MGDGLGQARLHHVEPVSVVAFLVGGDDLKGVDGVTVQGGVHLGVQDAVAGLIEIAANAREQIGLVGRIDHDLHAFASQ